MKNPLKKLFTKFNSNSQSGEDRRLELEVLENRILYSAAPVDTAPADEPPIEEYAVDMAYEEHSEEGTAQDTPPTNEGTSSSGGDTGGSQETQILNPEEGTAGESGELDQETLEAMAASAEAIWANWGLTAEQQAALDAITYQVGDLEDGSLGFTDGNVITLDRDAGGFGWFIDPTPGENEEFQLDENGNLTGALPESSYGVDLLTALLHEQGHVLGLAHQSEGLMDDDLGIGSRMLPVEGQAVGAVPGSQSEVSYLSFDAGTIIEASDAASSDLYGYSTAISGDLAIVGSRLDDDGGSSSGSAYIYQNINGTWTEVAKLTASDPALGDQFGFSVSIEGDYAVVGALFGDANLNSTGAAYVFHRDAGGLDQWGQVAKLTAADAAPGDYFGFSVAVSGDSVVVGAYQDDDASSASGSAYVFDRNEGGADNWGQVSKLTAADAAGGDNFGYAVDISGDSVIVGSRLDDDNGFSSGSAYIFERNLGGLNNFGQLTKLVASDGFGGDNFGVAVAIDGSTAVVGSRLDDDNGSASGSAYVFRETSGVWSEAAKLTADDAAVSDHFGASVAVFGNDVVVGSVFDDDSGNSSGSAYVFSKDEGGTDNWGQASKLVAPDALADEKFGQSVGIGSDGIIVGTFPNVGDLSKTGKAYIFAAANNQTSVGLDGSNNLIIEGLADVDNDITLVIEGTNVRISDANANLIAGAGAVEDNGDLLISLASITGSAGILVNTGDGNDTLTVDFSGGDFSKAISYNGGNPNIGQGDQLILTGGTFNAATYTFDNSNSGSIDLTGNQTITYTGLEPITANISVDDVTLNFEGGNEQIVVSSAEVGQTSVDSTAGVALVMTNPESSLTVNAGDGNDSFNILGIGSGFAADLNLYGQEGNDRIRVVGSGLNTGGGDLNADVEVIDLTSNVNAEGGNVYLNATTSQGLAFVIQNDLITSGDGSITIIASSGDNRAIHAFNSSVDIQVEDGDIEIFGHSDAREGVVLGGNLTVTGTGAILVQGTGGAQSTSRGVVLAINSNLQTIDGDIQVIGEGQRLGTHISSGGIETSGTGNITIEGRSSGDINGADGVQISSASVISTLDGNIEIFGSSSALSAFSNDGIQHTGGVIESTGDGNISFTGIGSGISGDGVYIGGSGIVRASGGDISIIGDSEDDDGISIFQSVSNTASGNIFLRGTGGPLTTDEGVVISSAGLLQVVDGNILITGESATGEGVVVASSGTVEATGTGDITISGVSQGNDIGVAIRAATVRTVDGDIELIGEGGLQGVALISGTAEVTGTGSIFISGIGGTSAGVVTSIPFSELTTNGGDIEIEGDNIILGGLIDAGTGSIFASALDSITVAGEVVANGVTLIADSNNDSNGSGGSIIVNGDATIDANFGGVSLLADENIHLTGITSSGTVSVHSKNGAVVDGGDVNTDVVGGRLIAIAADGIGRSTNSLDTSISNLEADGGVTGIYIENDRALMIGGISSMVGLSSDNAAIQISADGSLTVNEAINARGGDIDLSGGNVTTFGTGINIRADVTTDSDGNINLVGSGGTGGFDRGVSVSGTSTKVTTENGNITIIGESANDDGVSISSEVSTTGNGNVSIEGDGGTLPGEFGVIISSTSAKVASAEGDISIEGVSEGEEGVLIFNGAEIVANGGGSINIQGHGTGTGPGTSHGIVISNTGTSVTASGGQITLEGNSSRDLGVAVNGGATISNSDSGGINIIGNGGSGSTADGVQIGVSTTTISTEDGDIVITGTSIGDDGVQSTGRIISQNGDIEIQGAGTSANGLGVAVAGTGAEVSSHNGNVNLTGNSLLDDGVRVDFGSKVHTTGSGEVSIEGTSMGTNVGDSGVVVIGEVATSEGDTTITGTGDYTGLALANGAQVNAGGEGNLSLTGTGGAGRGVHLVNGSAASTVNGDLTIEGFSNGLDGVDLEGSQVATTGTGNIDIQGSTLLMDAAALVDSAVDAAIDIAGDATISTIVAVGNVSIASANGVIRDLDNATDIRAASVTFSGVVAPGITQGILNVDGDFAFAEDSLFSLDLDGLLPGEGTGNHDQANVAGGVTISSGVGLTLKQTAAFSIGDTITILNNDGVDPVSGTFTGLAEGTFITAIGGNGVSSQIFQISYEGGDGNDVVLTAIAEADTSVSLDGDTLVIRDELNNDTDDVYTISVVGNDLMIADPNQVLGNQITGATQSSLSVIWVPLNLFTRIRIESLGGNDIVNIEDLPGYNGGIDIDAGAGFDVINYNAAVTLNGGEDIVFRSETINLGNGSAINATDMAGDVGNVVLLAGRNISGDDASITTANGDINLEANIDGVESGSFTGIDLDHGSIVRSTGTGDINLTGRGGDSGNSNKGIDLEHGTLISAADGNISLIGSGGDGNNHNIGISIDHGSTLEATGLGSIALDGTGGAGKQSNSGIYIAHGSAINTVYGSIDLLGTGGDATGKFNVGIEIFGSSIGSLFGNINVIAFGGGGDKFNHGLVLSGSSIYSDNGLVDLMGTAGEGNKSDDIKTS